MIEVICKESKLIIENAYHNCGCISGTRPLRDREWRERERERVEREIDRERVERER